MLESLDKLGVPRRDLVIKMFGGSNGIALRGVESTSYNIGRRNVEMARHLLKFERLKVSVEDVGRQSGPQDHVPGPTRGTSGSSGCTMTTLWPGTGTGKRGHKL